MIQQRRFASFASMLIVLCLCVSAKAELAAGTATLAARNDQLFTITEGSPFLGIGGAEVGDEVPISALGSFTVDWGADGDGNGTTDVTSFSASFTGSLDEIGAYEINVVGDGPGAGFTGELTNITQLGGQLLSGTFTVNTTFSINLIDFGVMIYSDGQAVFQGAVDTSALVGTVFEDPGTDDTLNMLMDHPVAGTLITGTSSARSITVVPEPSTLALFGLGLVGLVFWGRRERKIRG